MTKRLVIVLFILMLLGLPALADDEVSLFPQEGQAVATPSPEASPAPAPEASPAPEAVEGSAREELINLIIENARTLSDKAGGRPQRAHYSGDIYVCKNFTVHVFRENSGDFRLAEHLDTPLVIPNNLDKNASKPYSYGIAWEDIALEAGNPFYAAHSFYYDDKQSKQENRERALSFMREVKRGDFFQMSANYQYGVGAHSLIFTQDYNGETDSVTWTDSNMNGTKKNGLRYGYVQFDAVKKIDWFVDAFCQRGRGATLYRLRDDIVKR